MNKYDEAIEILSKKHRADTICGDKDECLKNNEAIDLAIEALRQVREEKEREKEQPISVYRLSEMAGQTVWIDGRRYIVQLNEFLELQICTEEGEVIRQFKGHNYGDIWVAYDHDVPEDVRRKQELSRLYP